MLWTETKYPAERRWRHYSDTKLEPIDALQSSKFLLSMLGGAWCQGEAFVSPLMFSNC